MVVVSLNSRFTPSTPLQALLLAEAHVRVTGNPHLSPLTIVKLAKEHGEVNAGIFSGKKLTLKELLPGLRLRLGSSEIEIVRLRPTENEVTYKARGTFFKIDTNRFLQLANQQGYRKIWDLKTFLNDLKNVLKPILAAVPLMWVLKLVTDAVRKRPTTFESSLPRKVTTKL